MSTSRQDDVLKPGNPSVPQPTSVRESTNTYLPKNKSTGNLLSHAQDHPLTVNTSTRQQRMSIDAGSLERLTRSPVVPEHEHGLGTSGLRRIRQQPRSRAPTGGLTPIINNRSSELDASLPSSRRPSAVVPTGPISPLLPFGEDLTRFPTESLHSFSFAHQSEEFIHNRQNVLKRSIDFMRDKLGWAANNPAILAAQAKLSGDQEVQSMVELLTRANLMGQEGANFGSLGPVTGPVQMSNENIFDQSFYPRSESPTSLSASPSDVSRTTSATSSSVTAASQTQMRPPALRPKDSEQASSEAPPPTADTHRAPPERPRLALKRTFTDVVPLTLQSQLTDALAQPYKLGDDPSVSQIIQPSALPTSPTSALPSTVPHMGSHPAPHGHDRSRWAPAAQAIFTTEAQSPWTITNANDLACLVFGVTKAEVRKLGILEVVKEERRDWLEEKLRDPDAGSSKMASTQVTQQKTAVAAGASNLLVGKGVTARLLSKPPSRVVKARAQTDDGVGSSYNQTKTVKSGMHHTAHKSRGVLLCGDVVPIQKRNGAVGAASLWVKEKRGGLIWVVEEIAEDVVLLSVDEVGCVTKAQGSTEAIWGSDRIRRGMDVKRLIPDIPKRAGTHTGALDLDKIATLRNFTARTSNDINIPVTVEQVPREPTFRVSSFPHIAGIMVISASTLTIQSSNTVVSSALFGQTNPNGLHVNDLIPSFDKILRVITDEDHIQLVDGIVVPELSFRRSRALLAMREGKADAAAVFLKPSGVLARHRDGSDIMVDVQMRVVKSEKTPEHGKPVIEETIDERLEEDKAEESSGDIVFALWVTYSRHLHATNHGVGPVTPLLSRPGTPPHQPSPGQTVAVVQPVEMDSDDGADKSSSLPAPVSLLTTQLQNTSKNSASSPNMPDIASLGGAAVAANENQQLSTEIAQGPPKKKTINDFVVIEEMGQGAYGQVKLCRYKNTSKKMVIKYVTKRRILVDTWTRDRRLGTVPLEIHVLDFLRRDGFKHPNIVEMADFFEDDINYYIEMIPHGLPGMDLFDYIELRVNMDEIECRNIFTQVANAVHFLHTQAKVVHRDIKDENVILDGEGNIKLIDFGSAAYIKNGPFDVFVGTIDYAAPEVLAGKSYRGKEQDVWALGILLYTIVYKENPFYSIDEIMDHDLRVPYIMSEESIDLIRQMLNRDVEKRITIGMVLEHKWCQMEIA